MAKRSTEKQYELDKYLALTIATIDYGSKFQIGSFVTDGHDQLIEVFEWQKNQVRKNYEQGRLDRMVKNFERSSSYAKWKGGLDFAKYLKEETGYDVDVFAELNMKIQSILKNGSIKDFDEQREISQYLKVYENHQDENYVSVQLLSLNYDPHPVQSSSKANERTYSKEYEEDGMIVQEFHLVTGGSRDHEEFDSAKSPDKLKSLFTSKSRSRNFASTSVSLHFPNGSGGIFQANVMSPDIKAFFKDNQTVVIRTSSAFETPIRVKHVESHGERINIEYEDIENN